jgi:hypothetical protein
MRKGDKTPKDKRKARLEVSREQETVETARERTTTLSGNPRKLLQTEPKKNNHILYQKRRYDRKTIKGSLLASMPV